MDSERRKLHFKSMKCLFIVSQKTLLLVHYVSNLGEGKVKSSVLSRDERKKLYSQGSKIIPQPQKFDRPMYFQVFSRSAKFWFGVL